MDRRIINSFEEAVKKTGQKASEAGDWFQNKIEMLRGKNITPEDSGPSEKGRFPKDMEKTFMSTKMNARSIGRMMMYAYDPKTKHRLPYYDILPLILIVDADARGFYGINLHYIPPMLRKFLLNTLKSNLIDGPSNGTRLSRDEVRRLKFNYRALKRMSEFAIMKPCFKRYLFSNVRSSFMYIAPSEWDKTIMLPTERFVKATKQKVFRDSMASTGHKTQKGLIKDVKTTKFFRGSDIE